MHHTTREITSLFPQRTMKAPRFSLRMLFVVTTVVALLTATLRSRTASLALFVFLTAGMLGMFALGIIRGLEGGKRLRAITLVLLAILLAIGSLLFLPPV